MAKKMMNLKDPDIIASEKALRRAARRALELGLQTGTPVYVMENGQIVDLTKQVYSVKSWSMAYGKGTNANH